MLATYFGVGFAVGVAQLPPDATLAQVLHAATQYHRLWYMAAWLQATGSLLSVLFFVGLVRLAKAATRLSGIATTMGSSVLLGIVLMEGVFTMDLSQAAANGHPATALTSFDLMTVFTHIYPIVPAPLIFLALGWLLRSTQLLPRFFSTAAIGIGLLFVIIGLVSLLTLPWLTIVVLSLQGVWVLSAATVFTVRSFRAARKTFSYDDDS